MLTTIVISRSFDKHKYVVIETPQRKYYYEALAMVIVPEDTAFYRTSFESDKGFKQQLDIIYDQASVKKKVLKGWFLKITPSFFLSFGRKMKRFVLISTYVKFQTLKCLIL